MPRGCGAPPDTDQWSIHLILSTTPSRRAPTRCPKSSTEEWVPSWVRSCLRKSLVRTETVTEDAPGIYPEALIRKTSKNVSPRMPPGSLIRETAPVRGGW